MNKKTIRRINGGIAIYYGVGSAITAVLSLVAIGAWLFKVYAGDTEFSWGTLVMLTVITAGMAAIAYSILRVGYEQIEE